MGRPKGSDKYTFITKEDAYELSALGKFVNWINDFYYKENQKLVGKSKVQCIYRNIANINKARSIDTEYIKKKFGDDQRVVDPYGPATYREKDIIRDVIQEFMDNYDPHPENKTELYEMHNPNAKYWQKRRKEDNEKGNNKK